MIGKVKRLIAGKISNILRSAVRREIEEVLPVVSQLIEFQNSSGEDRSIYLTQKVSMVSIKELMLSCNEMKLETLTAFPGLEKPVDETTWNVLGIGRAV